MPATSKKASQDYLTVRGKLLRHGLTLRSFALRHGYKVSTVYDAAQGKRDGQISREINQRLEAFTRA